MRLPPTRSRDEEDKLDELNLLYTDRVFSSRVQEYKEFTLRGRDTDDVDSIYRDGVEFFDFYYKEAIHKRRVERKLEEAQRRIRRQKVRAKMLLEELEQAKKLKVEYKEMFEAWKGFGETLMPKRSRETEEKPDPKRKK